MIIRQSVKNDIHCLNKVWYDKKRTYFFLSLGMFLFVFLPALSNTYLVTAYLRYYLKDPNFYERDQQVAHWVKKCQKSRVNTHFAPPQFAKTREMEAAIIIFADRGWEEAVDT